MEKLYFSVGFVRLPQNQFSLFVEVDRLFMERVQLSFDLEYFLVEVFVQNLLKPVFRCTKLDSEILPLSFKNLQLVRQLSNEILGFLAPQGEFGLYLLVNFFLSLQTVLLC